MTNPKKYRTVFLVITLGLVLVAASPMFTTVVELPENSNAFSELWLLGPEHTADDYPYNVTEGEAYNVFVCLGNQMTSSEYYKLYVKFGNNTQFNFDRSEPSSLPHLYEFQAFVGDEGFWESPVSFGFQNVTLVDNVMVVDNVTTVLPIQESMLSVDEVTINGIVFPVDATTSWDSADNGFIFRLSFELWHFDEALNDFSFHERVVDLRLNMTIST
jgi:hypothetical protein